MKDFYIAGIGSSAGGLAAILDFFEARANTRGPISFVVIQHLPRDYSSQLHYLMGKFRFQVTTISDGLEAKPGIMYVPPAGSYVSINSNVFSLKDRPAITGKNQAIDHFFKSLSGRKDKAIGIIMSGTGSDGTLGVIAIDKAGGTVIVQDPETALLEGMPMNSIAFDHPDYILPPAKMSAAIDEVIKNGMKRRA